MIPLNNFYSSNATSIVCGFGEWLLNEREPKKLFGPNFQLVTKIVKYCISNIKLILERNILIPLNNFYSSTVINMVLGCSEHKTYW